MAPGKPFASFLLISFCALLLNSHTASARTYLVGSVLPEAVTFESALQVAG